MNAHQAADLTARIVDSWPAGAWPTGTVSEWTHDLAALDYDIAERTRRRLRDTIRDRSGPTWAQFVQQYRALEPHPDTQISYDGEPVDPTAHIAAIRADLARRGRPA